MLNGTHGSHDDKFQQQLEMTAQKIFATVDVHGLNLSELMTETILTIKSSPIERLVCSLLFFYIFDK